MRITNLRCWRVRANFGKSIVFAWILVTFTLFPLKQLERMLTETLFPPYVTAAIVSVGGLLKQKTFFFRRGTDKENLQLLFIHHCCCAIFYTPVIRARSICIPLSDHRVFNYLLSSNSLYRVLYLLCVTPHKLQRAPLHVASCPAVLASRCVVAPLIIPITLLPPSKRGQHWHGGDINTVIKAF